MITKWKCIGCGQETSNDDIQQQLGMARLDVYATGMDVKPLERFISKYSKILNPNHYLVIEMKQKLAAILRNICDTSKELDSNILERKIELCSEMLPILRTLQPGISRLSGKFQN